MGMIFGSSGFSSILLMVIVWSLWYRLLPCQEDNKKGVRSEPNNWPFLLYLCKYILLPRYIKHWPFQNCVCGGVGVCGGGCVGVCVFFQHTVNFLTNFLERVWKCSGSQATSNELFLSEIWNITIFSPI